MRSFGVRRFGAALVVPSVAQTLIRADPQRIFVLSILNLGGEYQSGAEPPHSKGFADLSDFAKALGESCHAARQSPSASNSSIPDSPLIMRASVFSNATFGCPSDSARSMFCCRLHPGERSPASKTLFNSDRADGSSLQKWA